MEAQPREENTAGVSSDLQRLFEQSSFGSPEAQQAYTEPPAQLVTDIINRVNVLIGIERFGTGRPIDGQHRIEAHLHHTPPPHADEQADAAATIGNRLHDRVLSRPVGVCLAESREVSRTADGVVESSGSLLVPGGDLRVMSVGDREETRAVVAEWRELLSACPAGAFGAEGSAMVLGTVAMLAEALIADRDERAAMVLLQDVWPHVVLLGRHHPAGFGVRRARAEALSELGRYQEAEMRLRGLSEDEQRTFGSADPRTELLLPWVLVGQDRLREADDRFGALEHRLPLTPGADTLLLHVQCRHAWLRGRLRSVDESVSDYARVIGSRTIELGEDHPDTLDARHSRWKTLVEAGQGAQAPPFLQALAEDRARVLGDRHPDTLETLKYLHLAHVQAEPGNDRVVRCAIRELVEIDRIQRERHGQAHPMRQDTVASLGELLRGEPISQQQAPITDEEQLRTIPRSPHKGASRNNQSTPELLAR